MDELLLELSKRGIRLYADGGRLGINAPKGALSEQLRAALATNKEALVSMLTCDAAAAGATAAEVAAYEELAEIDDSSSAETPFTPSQILETSLDLSYAWDYGETRTKLRELYEKAKHSQWISEEVLPWNLQPDLTLPIGPEELNPLWGSPVWARMKPAERERCHYEMTAWMVSQFVHGEQGALLATAQLVDCVTDLDSKLYGATQVVDEARHVEVYNRYLQEKVGQVYPVSQYLKTLLDLLLKDGRWDMKFLGMQILIEGMALSLLAMLRDTARDPLLRQITAYVMSDEARHMAYGIVSLRDYYEGQSESFKREREDFTYEAARLMRDRFLFREVWERLGLPVRECMDITLRSPTQVIFRQRMFAKIVPTVKRMGLLSDRQRKHFAELGILQFENAAESDLELSSAPATRDI